MDPAALCELLQKRFADGVIATHHHRGDATVTLGKGCLLEAARFLKEEPSLQMNFLVDLTAVDYLNFGQCLPAGGAFANQGVPLAPPSALQDDLPWPGSATPERFEVVYHFFSLCHRHRIRVKVPVGVEDLAVDSLVSLWAAADWFEREVWDMFGIHFQGHPNLKRILMYEEFQGHPLRKDYPVNKRQPLLGPIN